MRSSLGKMLLSVTLSCGVLGGSLAGDSSAPAIGIQLLPGDLQWNSNPKLHGLQTAILVGDPKAPEPYAERISFPPNYRLEPHSHPNEFRMVTVLSGTLYYAFGDTFDENRLTALPAGSFFTEPKDEPHYAMTKDESVVLELHAIGPAGTQYVEAGGKPQQLR